MPCWQLPCSFFHVHDDECPYADPWNWRYGDRVNKVYLIQFPSTPELRKAYQESQEKNQSWRDDRCRVAFKKNIRPLVETNELEGPMGGVSINFSIAHFGIVRTDDAEGSSPDKFTNELFIAKMEDRGGDRKVIEGETLFVEKDADSFYIYAPSYVRYDPTVNVVWGEKYCTVAGKNADGTEREVRIDFHEKTETDKDGNRHTTMRSRPIMLVSDDVDNKYPEPGGNDYTHKLALGEHFRITGVHLEGSEEREYDDGRKDSESFAIIGGPLKVAMPVLVQKIVNLNVVIFRDKKEADGGKEVVTKAAVLANLKEAQERFAQAGIKLTWGGREDIDGIRVEDPPGSVNPNDFIMPIYHNQLAATDVQRAIDAFPKGKDNYGVFYVGKFRAGFKYQGIDEPLGFAITETGYPDITEGPLTGTSWKGYHGNCFIEREGCTDWPFVLPHELLHLLGLGHIIEIPNISSLDNDIPTRTIYQRNLMWPRVITTENTLGAPKRLNTNQENALHGRSGGN